MAFNCLCLAVILQALVLMFLQLRVMKLQRDLRFLDDHFYRFVDMLMEIAKIQKSRNDKELSGKGEA